ncbi:MAG: hypothetical protein ACYS0E_08315, partial [Planctomycetota bacterium]
MPGRGIPSPRSVRFSRSTARSRRSWPTRSPPRENLRTKPKWGKNVRLLKAPLPAADGVDVRSIPGGFLVQDRDSKRAEASDLNFVTERRPTEAEIADLVFAQRICKHVKSNAIVLVKDRMVVGVGAG